MASRMKYLENILTGDEAEALAALEGLRLAMEIGIWLVQLETDSSLSSTFLIGIWKIF